MSRRESSPLSLACTCGALTHQPTSARSWQQHVVPEQDKLCAALDGVAVVREHDMDDSVSRLRQGQVRLPPACGSSTISARAMQACLQYSRVAELVAALGQQRRVAMLQGTADRPAATPSSMGAGPACMARWRARGAPRLATVLRDRDFYRVSALRGVANSLATLLLHPEGNTAGGRGSRQGTLTEVCGLYTSTMLPFFKPTCDVPLKTISKTDGARCYSTSSYLLLYYT